MQGRSLSSFYLCDAFNSRCRWLCPSTLPYFQQPPDYTDGCFVLSQYQPQANLTLGSYRRAFAEISGISVESSCGFVCLGAAVCNCIDLQTLMILSISR